MLLQFANLNYVENMYIAIDNSTLIDEEIYTSGFNNAAISNHPAHDTKPPSIALILFGKGRWTKKTSYMYLNIDNI